MKHFSAPRFAMKCGSSVFRSERQQDVRHLLAVARLLNVGDLAAAAIRNARLRDLLQIHRVVGSRILGPHDAGNDQFAHFEIDANLLFAFDHEIAVRQDLRHHRRDVGLQDFLTVDVALALVIRGRVGRQPVFRDRLSFVNGKILVSPNELGDAEIFVSGFAFALGLVIEAALCPRS